MVQRAVAMRLEAIDEQDVLDGSEGVRPGRSPQEARHAVRERCMPEGMGGIVEAEVRGDVESLDRTRLREVLRQRVNDGSRWRLLGQWRRAGVRAHGVLTPPETGVVQGGVISPVLAHRCLHQVLDEWVEREGPPRVKGRSCLTRVADDGVIGGERAADAQKSRGV